MQNVVMLNVVMMTVVAPPQPVSEVVDVRPADENKQKSDEKGGESDG
jgi:hypothetical protein